MKNICLIAIFFLIGTIPAFAYEQDSTLIKLDSVLKHKEVFENERLETIKSLKQRLNASPGTSNEIKFGLYNQLYKNYRSFIYDSAFIYAQKMIDLGYEMNDSSKIGHAKNQLGFILLSSGMFKETFDTLKTVSVSHLNDSSKIEYYALMARALYDLCDYNHDQFYCDFYTEDANKYIDFAANLAKPDSYQYLYLNGLKSLRSQDLETSINYLNKLFEGTVTLTDHQSAISFSTLGYEYLILGDSAKAITLLAKASIADVSSAVKETSALTTLARLLYARGDIEKAYNYINHSMDDATFYGARQRINEVGNVLPIIASARLNTVEGEKKSLLNYSIGLTILSILTIVFAILTFVQAKRIKNKDQVIQANLNELKDKNEELIEANKIKDEYLGYYFSINSEYIAKLEKLKDSIGRKLSTNKTGDIQYIVNRIDLKKEREELYVSFDKVFLKLFPEFINEFNALFEPKDQTKVEDDQLLNTELRIFALIRMGITDSDKLANILGYSVNTIYAYKNRIKNKSIVPNEEFEKRIMAIKSS
ncbi:DUF6377 domain-containing protein [Marinigracilibium pacificum]|uniref:Tetratricopeptide repeat protein n=1 Tax=Marinigracilibium pacificum TaxID=2729599 RepID=A0A848J4U0_9BACT|nr:DUF6377 domain-containing protein [Marinigracilibium pacificum]NMM49530.1 tetratricopeptide repeat protein [Marinigracilibium pacificum]